MFLDGFPDSPERIQLIFFVFKLLSRITLQHFKINAEMLLVAFWKAMDDFLAAYHLSIGRIWRDLLQPLFRNFDVIKALDKLSDFPGRKGRIGHVVENQLFLLPKSMLIIPPDKQDLVAN